MDLVTTHLGADLDGMASLVAARRLDPRMELSLPGSMDASAHRFWKEHEDELPPLIPAATLRKRLARETLGRLWVVDTADPARIGYLADWAERFAEVRAWDNHPPAPSDLPRAPMPQVGACTSAWVLELARRRIRPSVAEAGLFLLGIHADTGHFTFATTHPLDHRAASLCLRWGASLEWVARYLPKGYTAHQLRRLSEIADSVEIVDSPSGPLAIGALELETYEPDLSVLLEELRAAERWPAAFLIAGRGERVDLIGRSAGEVDVGAVMRSLGGGGHPEAASAVVRGTTLREAKSMLRQAIEEGAGAEALAGDVATRHFVSLPMSATIAEASERLRRRRIDSLPLTRGSRIVGLVGRRDVDAALAHGLGERPVGEISMGPPPWIAADRPLSEARLALVAGPSRLLMVGEEPDAPVGVLTRGAVLRASEEPPLSRGAGRTPNAARLLAQVRKALGPERWRWVEALGEVAADLGMGLHLVGGAVRDLFLGLPLRDVDLLVEGSAPELAEKAAARHGGKVRSHRAFGTATWTIEEQHLDLASSRAEHYRNIAALPTVELPAALRQDLFRRDFTCNAMAIALDPGRAGTLSDPFGGLADLRAGNLRVLHGLSFHDDPTRAFRAARFAARFDFRLAPQTRGLLQSARKAGAFEKVSRERLGSELSRILEQKEVVQAFRLLRDWRLLEAISPGFRADRSFLRRIARARDRRYQAQGFLSEKELPSQEAVLWIELGAAIPDGERQAASRLVTGGRSHLRAFLHGACRVEAALERMRSGQGRAAVGRALVGLEMEECIAAWARAEDPKDAKEVEWWLREGRSLRPAVRAADLFALGAKEGPRFGAALEAAKEAAWDGASAEEQLAVARSVLFES